MDVDAVLHDWLVQTERRFVARLGYRTVSCASVEDLAPHIAPGDGWTIAEADEFVATHSATGARVRGTSRQQLALCIAPETPSFPTVSIAGTNGKSSVCAMTVAALVNAGLSRVVSHFADAFRLNHDVVPTPSFPSHDAYVRTCAVELGASVGVFEQHASRRGGYMTPLMVGAITSIGRDHQPALGHSLDSIARRKAVVVRAAKTVVLGEGAYYMRSVITDELGPGVAIVHAGAFDGFVPFAGAFQRENAAVAATICAVLGVVPDFHGAQLAGRCERRGDLIIDLVKNGLGARRFAEHLRTSGYAPCPVYLSLRRLDHMKDIFGAFADVASEYVLLPPLSERGGAWKDSDLRMARRYKPARFADRIDRTPAALVGPFDDRYLLRST